MMTKIAFGSYLLITLITLVIGIYYLSASQIMPYLLTAMGATWEEFSYRIHD